MDKLFASIAAAVLIAAPLTAQAQAWGGHAQVGVGVQVHTGGGYYAGARRYDRGERDAWRDWDTRDGWSGRDGWSYRGRWSDRDGWGDADDGRDRGDWGDVDYGLGGGGFDVGAGLSDTRYYPSLADYGPYRAGDYASGFAYSYPDADGRYQPFAYRYADADDAYYADGGRGDRDAAYAPNVGWSAGAPPADCGQWIWREGRGAYEWVPRPCGCDC